MNARLYLRQIITWATSKKVRQPLYRIGILLGLGLLIWRIAIGVRSLLLGGFEIIDLRYLLFSILAAFAATTLQIYIWKRIMGLINVRLSHAEVFQNYSLSFLPRYVPGTVWGYLSRAEWLNRAHQIPYSISNFGSILELSASLTANLFAVSLLWLPAPWLPLAGLACIGAANIGIFFFHWLLTKPFISTFLKIEKSASKQPFSLLEWSWITLLWMITWLIQGLAFYFTFSAFRLNPAFHFSDLLRLTGAYSLSWLIGFVVFFIPAGLGLRELALFNLLETNFGLPAALANGVSVLFRLIMSFAEFIWVVIAFIWKKLSPKAQKPAARVGVSSDKQANNP